MNHIRAAVETITPEIAAAMLENNHDNRPISMIAVDQLRSDIINGRWVLTGQPIILAADGSVNDGQHRLTAIAKAGVPVASMVVRGATHDSRNAVDIGRTRLAGDILQMSGMANGNNLAGIASAVISAERSGFRILGALNRVSKAEIIARCQNDPRIEYSFRTGYRVRDFASARAASFARYLIPDSDKSDAFFDGFATGAGLEDGNPVLALRNWWLRNGRRAPLAPAAEANLRAWAAYRDGRSLTGLRLSGEFPNVRN